MGQPKRKEKLAEPPAPEEVKADGGEAGVERWQKPKPLSPKGWAVLAMVVLAVNLPLIHYYLFRGEMEATVSLPYSDDFSNPATVRNNYWSTGGYWRVVNGELLSPGVKNNPLWLKAKLPQNVAVEFDVRSMSPEGDVKVEIFGDGSDHASGYVLIHGGWNNSLSIIARLDEHGVPLSRLKTGELKKGTRMRVEASPYRVELGRKYRWRIERRGSLLTWHIDGQKFMEFDDPFPLAGKGHDRFGFSSWEAQLYFDNFKVEPL
ncbi:MAG: hypothetical protein ACOZIN_13745 [Myxococcota bacterium]